MAEENTKSLALPGNTDSGGNSPGSNNDNGKPSFSDKESDNDAYKETFSSIRRYSVSPKITPHYLLASTGSCHDNCKYGFKSDSEEIEKRPWLKKFSFSSSGKHNGVMTLGPTELQVSPIMRSRSFPVNLSHFSKQEASSNSISSPHRHKIMKGKIMQPHKMIEVPSKQDPSSDRRMPKKGKGITAGTGEKSFPDMRLPASHESGHKKHKSEKKLNHSSEKISPPLHSQRVKARLATSLARSIKETSAISKETLKSSKIISEIPSSIQISRSANGINKRRDDEKISKENTKLSPSSLTERTVSERVLKRDDVLTKKNKAASDSSTKKTLVFPGSSLSSRPSIGRKTATKPRNIGSLKPVSSVNDLNRILRKDVTKNGDKHVPEKTLHVVQIETKVKPSESTEVWDIIPPLPESNLSPDSPCLSSNEEVDGREEDEVKPEAEEKEEGQEHTDEDEVEQQGDEKGQLEEDEEQQLEDEEMETDEEGDCDDEEEEEENVYKSDEGDNSITGEKNVNYNDLSDVEEKIQKPLSKVYSISESEDSVQVKPKFRRGKILDIHSENEGPRKLHFRRGRSLKENGSSSEIRRRNFNRRHSTKEKSNSTSDQKIVLRHQDMEGLEGKKDDRGLLLNNVIKKTASKLAESRKSKVKALVGAFETVISRHDGKPARG